MKTSFKLLTTVLITVLYPPASHLMAQNIGINTTGADPHASSLLDLNSTNKGFLITRAEPTDISSPAFGLMTLAPSDSCFYLYSGEGWVSFGGAGKNCSGTYEPEFPCDGTITAIVDITSTTGKIWMDRNLGASQVATGGNDPDAYGDLYQWGRCSDGHEKSTSSTTTTKSTTDNPGHGDFITTTSTHNWRSSSNDNLWQGVAGINNPCPSGYRVPTDIELEDEFNEFSTNNTTGAFASALKFTGAGFRGTNGVIYNGSLGYYWSSTVSGLNSRRLFFSNYSANMGTATRSTAFSVRCIKD